MLVAAAGKSDEKNDELMRLRELYQNLAVGGRVCEERTEAGNVQHVRARCFVCDGEDGDACAS
jgi:uncharacterized protein YjhX (UPF0386 family)